MKKRNIARGITVTGDKIEKTIEAMKKINEKYKDRVIIDIYISKAGDQVIKY